METIRAHLQTLASSTSAGSVATVFRKKRFALFEELIASAGPGPLTILDVGGTQDFWEIMGFTDTPHRIILLNLFAVRVRHPNFLSRAGDACRLDDFADQSVDVVFSNSVIEHLGTRANQQQMAEEIRRVGKSYFVQTPNFYFPVEPHFLCPFFHWLPYPARLWLIRRFSLGNITRKPFRAEAMKTLDEFRLLKKTEVKALFPEAEIHAERVLGFTKSYIAVKPWRVSLRPHPTAPARLN